MILETLLPQLEFQSNIEDAVKQKMIKSRRQVEEIAATAYSSNDFDFLLCKRMPLTRLVVVVYLLTQKYAEYIIPCHRVVGTSGSLTGYAGGIDKKVRLLELEHADMSRFFVPKKGTAL